ncbi:MAG: vanadium-dependent haloperoxidase [Kofleriaceae bacterium]
MKLIQFAATVAMLTTGCVIGEDAEPRTNTEVDPQASLAPPGTTNVVTTWAGIAADVIVRPTEAEPPALRTPGYSSMLMAQVQLAVYDTMVALREDSYEFFSYHTYCAGSANREAAVATTAYRILKTRQPGRAAFLDAQYATTLGAIPNGHRKTKGIELGESVAAHYIALRANDNLDTAPVWVQPTPGPGVWEPTAATPPADYRITFAPPFTFDISQTPSYFPPPPPALTSSEYAFDWTVVRDFGRSNSTVRTEAQRQLALWTSENAFRFIARNLNELAVANGLSTMKAARLFAMVWTSCADAQQVGASAKFSYNFWRPVHAIQRADTDGNDATVADPTWTALLNVNNPEYPSAHGFFSAGAMVGAVRAFFKTDNVPWENTAVGVVGLTETTRTFTTLSQYARDIWDGRILAGLHFDFSMEAGIALGERVANHVTSNFFRHTR